MVTGSKAAWENSVMMLRASDLTPRLKKSGVFRERRAIFSRSVRVLPARVAKQAMMMALTRFFALSGWGSWARPSGVKNRKVAGESVKVSPSATPSATTCTVSLSSRMFRR